MSGTSLDGVDIAFCLFEEHKGHWHYEILAAKTFGYDKAWRDTLAGAHLLSGEDLIRLDRNYGIYLGKIVKKYVSQTGIKPSLIASHGHTIFHNPSRGYTFQAGHGAYISGITGIPVVDDFRSMDVALHGQGAPLVPMGDKLLFGSYDSCLNLGGFANISFTKGQERIAFDICPVNIVINYLAREQGKSYDRDGVLAKPGRVDKNLLQKLNSLPYYRFKPPKSLSREWLEMDFMPFLHTSSVSATDKMATVYEHVIHQLLKVISRNGLISVLVTGGGAFNKYLIKLLKKGSGAEIVLPDKMTIKYKEALIFACLGLLRLDGKINILSSVTGAAKDSTGGALHML